MTPQVNNVKWHCQWWVCPGCLQAIWYSWRGLALACQGWIHSSTPSLPCNAIKEKWFIDAMHYQQNAHGLTLQHALTNWWNMITAWKWATHIAQIGNHQTAQQSGSHPFASTLTSLQHWSLQAWLSQKPWQLWLPWHCWLLPSGPWLLKGWTPEIVLSLLFTGSYISWNCHLPDCQIHCSCKFQMHWCINCTS